MSLLSLVSLIRMTSGSVDVTRLNKSATFPDIELTLATRKRRLLSLLGIELLLLTEVESPLCSETLPIGHRGGESRVDMLDGMEESALDLETRDVFGPGLLYDGGWKPVCN